MIIYKTTGNENIYKVNHVFKYISKTFPTMRKLKTLQEIRVGNTFEHETNVELTLSSSKNVILPFRLYLVPKGILN